MSWSSDFERRTQPKHGARPSARASLRFENRASAIGRLALAPLSQCRAHPGERQRQLFQHDFSFEAKHAVTHARELAIAASIGGALELMAPTVDLNDLLVTDLIS